MKRYSAQHHSQCAHVPCSLRKRLSVSESSHTESDSSPPLTVRRRCCSAIIEMPRFAISTEDETAGARRSPSLLPQTPARGPRGEELPLSIPELPLERELKLDESPTTPGSTGSQLSRATLTRESCLGHLAKPGFRYCSVTPGLSVPCPRRYQLQP